MSPTHPTCTHSTYFLTCEDYDALLVRANGRCEVCATSAAEVPRGLLLIDHDHSKGYAAVRGLVCPSCNHLLGRVDRGSKPSAELRDAVNRYLASPWVTEVAVEVGAVKRDELGELVIDDEIDVRSCRSHLADVLHRASVHGRTTYVTSRGRRIAAFVPLAVADQAVKPPRRRKTAEDE